jgi:hypothetical protein
LSRCRRATDRPRPRTAAAATCAGGRGEPFQVVQLLVTGSRHFAELFDGRVAYSRMGTKHLHVRGDYNEQTVRWFSRRGAASARIQNEFAHGLRKSGSAA